MYVARNFHFSILTSQVIDSHYRLVRDCRISPTMALILLPHNPFTIFADNDDFQDGLHSSDEQNPCRGTTSIPLEELRAFGRHDFFRGPYKILHPDQYEMLLDIFCHEGVRITLRDYDPDNLQLWYYWIYMFLQLPRELVAARSGSFQQLRSSMQSLFGYGFTGTRDEFNVTNMITALKTASSDMEGSTVTDDKTNYSLTTSGGIELFAIGLLTPLVLYDILKSDLNDLRVHRGQLSYSGKSAIRKLNDKDKWTFPIGKRPLCKRWYAAFSRTNPEQMLFERSDTQISPYFAINKVVEGMLEHVHQLAGMMTGSAITKKPEHDTSALSSSTSIISPTAFYRQYGHRSYHMALGKFLITRRRHHKWWNHRNVLNALFESLNPQGNLSDEAYKARMKKYVDPEIKRFRRCIAILAKKDNTKLHDILRSHQIANTNALVERDEKDEMILAIAENADALDVIVPSLDAAGATSTSTRGSRDPTHQSMSTSSTSTRESTQGGGSRGSAQSTSTARGSTSASTQSSSSNASTSTRTSRRVSDQSTELTSSSTTGRNSSGPSRITPPRNNTSTSLFGHPLLDGFRWYDRGDQDIIELLKRFDKALLKLPIVSVASSLTFERDATNIRELINEAFADYKFNDEDLEKGGRLYNAFVYVLLNLHKSLSHQDCTAYRNLMMVVSTIFTTRGTVFLGAGDVLRMTELNKGNASLSAEQQWYNTQLRPETNIRTDRRAPNYRTLATPGTYLRTVMEDVIGITFNMEHYNAAVNQQENIRVQELNEELSRKRSARSPSVSNAKARRLARQNGGG